MRKKKPSIATLDETRINRNRGYAVIGYNDSTISTVHLKIGEKIRSMSDQQILNFHNEVLRAQQNLALLQQLAVQREKVKRPRLRRRHRIFWAILSLERVSEGYSGRELQAFGNVETTGKPLSHGRGSVNGIASETRS